MKYTRKICRSVAFASVIYLFLGLFCPINAQEITLDFADGLLPSAKGWTIHGQDQFKQPLTESQVAFVSGGILHLNTVPFGGPNNSNDTFFWWSKSTIGIDPVNYEYEIRMRSIEPNSFRSCYGGLLGAGIEVRVNFDSFITVNQPQLHLGGFTPASSSDPCFLLNLDASVFHTYKHVVQNDNQGTLYIDGVQVAQGVLIYPNYAYHEAVFGDLSTTGGNVIAEIEFIRIASLARAVDIDIKPGSFPNSVNPRSNGVISVAILTTTTFDARSVAPMSVRFGPNGAVEVHGRGHIEDADGDGDLDLVLHFRTQNTGIMCGNASASLTGSTVGGQRIRGSDSVDTVGCT